MNIHDRIFYGRTAGATTSISALSHPGKQKQIQAFESRWDVRITDEYHAFLLLVGNGGRGPPYYDLMPLGSPPGDYHESADFVNSKLNLPFPLTKSWVWEEDPDADEAAIDVVR